MSAEIIGHGVLHDALAGRLSAAGFAGVIAVHDDFRIERDVAIQRAARTAGKVLLHVRLDGPLGIIGPVVRPDAPGCVVCAERRRRPVAGLPQADLRGRHAGSEHLAPFVAIVAEIVAGAQGAGPGRVFVVAADTLAGQWHTFLPVGECPECGDLPADARALARPPARPVPSGGNYRERPLPASAGLRQRLLDWRYGVVPHVFRVQGRAPLAMCGSQFTVKSGLRDAGWGRGITYAEAETVAFFEALERHASFAPHGRRLTVRASLRDLDGDALDPRCLGLPEPGAGFLPFRDDLELAWVWGWSFGKQRPILCPAQCVYYGHLPAGDPGHLVHETSNGAASGASFEEATLHGLFEVIERDAFLLTWYGRLPVTELVVAGGEHREIDYLLDRAEAAGYRVRLFDVSRDLKVPVVWALAVTDDETLPKTFTAAGAHPDRVLAALGALREVVPDLHLHVPHPDREALRAMFADPRKVRSLEDHVALYTLPEAAARLDFVEGGAREPLSAGPDGWARADVGATLDALVAHVVDAGLDVIAVDLTSPEEREVGQVTVKVIVPGALPMTFGNDARRTRGLARLEAHAGTLDLPFHPHPFP